MRTGMPRFHTLTRTIRTFITAMCIDRRSLCWALVAAALLVVSPLGVAHETHGKSAVAQPMVETAFGRTGDPKRVTRTVRIAMADTMRFTPGAIDVKRGETIRFEVANAGKVMHEMVLGTLQDLKEHAELMRKHPGMEHDEPYMAHVAPGKTVTMVWQFTKPGEFHFGCLVPGHFEAGMVGKITVR
jgi:uncharacterized cupredoxin-like copper-binding protein